MKNKLLMLLILLIGTLFIASIRTSAGNEETVTVDGIRYIRTGGCGVGGDIGGFMITNPLISSEELPDALVFAPYEKWLEYRETLAKDKRVISVTKYVNVGDMETIAVVEPELIKVTVPISGSLPPETYYPYGPYSSCVAIEVSATWTSSDQTLGIGLRDAKTGVGVVRWFTGGSAWTQFQTDWTRSYYIDIFGYYLNTKTITYNGTITLYIW